MKYGIAGRSGARCLGLGLTGFEPERNPAQLALDWGVRRLGEGLQLRTRAGNEKPVTADFFPAYDADGGLLVALTPSLSPD